jgi:hypothetical protein
VIGQRYLNMTANSPLEAVIAQARGAMLISSLRRAILAKQVASGKCP